MKKLFQCMLFSMFFSILFLPTIAFGSIVDCDAEVNECYATCEDDYDDCTEDCVGEDATCEEDCDTNVDTCYDRCDANDAECDDGSGDTSEDTNSSDGSEEDCEDIQVCYDDCDTDDDTCYEACPENDTTCEAACDTDTDTCYDTCDESDEYCDCDPTVEDCQTTDGTDEDCDDTVEDCDINDGTDEDCDETVEDCDTTDEDCDDTVENCDINDGTDEDCLEEDGCIAEDFESYENYDDYEGFDEDDFEEFDEDDFEEFDDIDEVFEDLDEVEWAKDYIDPLTRVKAISKKDDKKYYPNRPISRAELVKIILESMNIKLDTIETPSFSDVPSNEWFFPYVEKAKMGGIVKGFPDGTFQPEKPVTRAEAVKIILLFLGATLEKPGNQIFDDVPLDAWFAQFVQTAHKLLIVKGYEDGTFRPNQPITRAEASKIIFLAIKVLKPGSKVTDIQIPDKTQPTPMPDPTGSSSMKYIGNIDFYTLFDEAEDANDLRTKIQQHLDNETKKGVTYILEVAVTLDGFVVLNSPTMKNAGFVLPDLFGEKIDYVDILAEECAKRNLILLLAIEDLAHIMEGSKDFESTIKKELITVQAVRQLVKEIAAYQTKYNGKMGVTEELFQGEFIQAIHDETRANNLVYMHYFDDDQGRADIWSTESYYIYPYDAENNAGDKIYLQYINEFGAAALHLGATDMMFGLANSFNKYSKSQIATENISSDYISSLLAQSANKKIETGCTTAGGWGFFNPSSSYNENQFPPTLNHVIPRPCILFMMRESNMNFISFILGAHDTGNNDQNELKYINNFNYKKYFDPIKNQYAAKSSDKKKLQANVVLVIPETDSEEEWEPVMESSLPTLTNALYIAGYDVLFSVNKFLPNSSLRIVLAPGEVYGEQIGDFPSDLLSQIKNETTVPTFIQPLGYVNESANFQKLFSEVFDYQGELDYAESEKTGIPSTVNYEFPKMSQSVKYRGISFGPDEINNAGNYFDDQSMTILNPDTISRSTTAVLQSDGKVLLLKSNHNYLILGTHIHQEMSSVYANIFAKANNLPTQVNSKGAYYGVTSLDSNGKARAAFMSIHNDELDITLPDGKRLYGSIPKWHLVIVANGQVIQYGDSDSPMSTPTVKMQ